jgi:hypothetical protein
LFDPGVITMTAQPASPPIHDIEAVLFHEFPRQPAGHIQLQELMALLLTKGRLPMIPRPRGR